MDYSCTIQYGSKKAEIEALYRTFRSVSAFTSERIKLSMRLVQNGETVVSSQTQANFHLKASEDKLCFYLPKDEDNRKLCFERQLPRKDMDLTRRQKVC